MKPSRQIVIVVVPALLGVGCLAGPAAAATTGKPYRVTVRDPAHDVVNFTTAPRPYSPSDDLRKITMRHNAKRVTVSFKTVTFKRRVAANTEFHYVLNIDNTSSDPTRSYMLAVDIGGSKAVLPTGSRVPHHKHLWESTSVVVLTNGQPTQRSCSGQVLVPSRRHVWIDKVPDSCLPHFHGPVTVRGSREREHNEPHGKPAHDFEDDFSG